MCVYLYGCGVTDGRMFLCLITMYSCVCIRLCLYRHVSTSVSFMVCVTVSISLCSVSLSQRESVYVF
jgi:hypothetical protein